MDKGGVMCKYWDQVTPQFPVTHSVDSNYLQILPEMMLELDDVKPTEITFKDKLFASKFSVISLAEIRRQTCIMKVVSRITSTMFLDSLANIIAPWEGTAALLRTGRP